MAWKGESLKAALLNVPGYGATENKWEEIKQAFMKRNLDETEIKVKSKYEFESVITKLSGDDRGRMREREDLLFSLCVAGCVGIEGLIKTGVDEREIRMRTERR